MNPAEEERRHPIIPLNAHEIALVLTPIIEPEFGTPQIVSTEMLSGGYSTTNYRVRMASGLDLVLRLYPYGNKSAASAAKEVALLGALQSRVPVPKIIASELDGLRLPYPFVVQEFVAGPRLDQALATERDPAALASIGQAVGFTLAQIHALNFPTAGLIGSDLKISEPFDDFASEMISYLKTHVQKNGTARTRMGSDFADYVLRFVEERGSVLQNLKRTRQLCHCDFNPKNILLKQVSAGVYVIAAVLDWEFAMSGSPLLDIGNMLRREEELPSVYRQAFLAGYERGAGPLEPEWRLAAALLDLTSQVEFLSSEAERPQVFANALAVIAKTIGVDAPTVPTTPDEMSES